MLVKDSSFVVIDAVVDGTVLVAVLVVEETSTELEVTGGRLVDENPKEVLSDDDDVVIEVVEGGVSVVGAT